MASAVRVPIPQYDGSVLMAKPNPYNSGRFRVAYEGRHVHSDFNDPGGWNIVDSLSGETIRRFRCHERAVALWRQLNAEDARLAQ